LSYDPIKSFSLIACFAQAPYILVVGPDGPSSIDEFLKKAKVNSGEWKYSSTGISGPHHLIAEYLFSNVGLSLQHVPAAGGARAIELVSTNQVQTMLPASILALPQAKSKQIKALAVTGNQRLKALPNVPTISESGLKGFEALAWFGMYAPPQMSPDLLKKISGDVVAALQSPQVKNQFSEQGADAGNMSQAEYAKYVDAEITKWAKVISDANIKID
jgi:tripartite-type tricarboxylate transporter receptor subunit TctC